MVLRALAIHEEIFGPEHPDVGMDAFHLASIYQRQERYEKAETTLLRVITIDEKTLPPEHPDRAFAFRSLAAVYQAQSRLPEAAALLERALAIDETALGEGHGRVLLDLALLGHLQAQQQESSARLPVFERLLANLANQQGPIEGAAEASLRAFSDLLRNLDRQQEAREVDVLLSRVADG